MLVAFWLLLLLVGIAGAIGPVELLLWLVLLVVAEVVTYRRTRKTAA